MLLVSLHNKLCFQYVQCTFLDEHQLSSFGSHMFVGPSCWSTVSSSSWVMGDCWVHGDIDNITNSPGSLSTIRLVASPLTLTLTCCTCSSVTLSCSVSFGECVLLAVVHFSVVVFALSVKMLASWSSYVPFVSPMFAGISFCKALVNYHAAATITTAFIISGIILYCCLKNTVSNTLMLWVSFTHILKHMLLCKRNQFHACPIIFLHLAYCALTLHTPLVLLALC